MSACRKEVPSLDKDETPGPRCAPLDADARETIRGLVQEAAEVVFTHDVATYCRLYASDSVEVSGRTAEADDNDVSVPFDVNVRYHTLREGTRTQTQPTWSVGVDSVEGDDCSARAVGTFELDFGSGGQRLGLDATVEKRDGRWVLTRSRAWPMSDRDADGNETPYDAEKWNALDGEVTRLLDGGDRGALLVQALYDAYRVREAYELAVAATDASPDDFGLLLLRSILASGVGQLDDMVQTFRQMRVLSARTGQALPQHVAQTLANIDAGVEFRGCPALPAADPPDAAP